MPQLPGLPPDPDAYKKNTKEQYEALGRFVEAYEAMIDEVRYCCTYLLATDDPKGVLVDIAFHHQAMTAKPLWDIFRALIAEFFDLEGTIIDHKQRETFAAVLKIIDSEYQALTSKRNTLLHGAWFIGYPSREDPNAEILKIRKLKVTADGLKREETPKDVTELIALANRCKKTRDWIFWLFACAPIGVEPISERFIFKSGQWQIILAGGPPEPLK